MFKRLAQGISRTRDNLLGGLKSVLGKKRIIDEETLEALESALLVADCGIEATQRIVDRCRASKADQNLDVTAVVVEEMVELLAPCEAPLAVPAEHSGPFVILVVGVNGAGKTTSIAKIGQRLKASGLSVMFAAGDTFRAAAVEQLSEWGRRLDIPVVAQATGADPASVLFDACAAAKARDIDVLLADTAGRLHTQSNLMAELEKVKRVIRKFDPTAPHETMLILDATMGQNALSQAQLFHEQIHLDSVTLTKLDGTAKGGIVFALAAALALPIRFIGIGETYDDLRTFSAREFADALMADAQLEDDEPAG
ncbi:MAG: signal recognition particle-docking protein FtsY [Gammaproteobacteria bacterium]|jgi:fused signal recognition particle receptor